MADVVERFTAQLDAFTLYHLLQEEEGNPRSSGGGPNLPPVGHAFAGSIATATAKSIVYPLSLCITRLQVQRSMRKKGETDSAAKDADQEYSSIFDAAQKIYKNEGGLKAFYVGCPPDVAKGILDSFLFFFSYNFLHELEKKRSKSKNLSVVKDLAVGVAAGCFSKFVTQPIDNIVTRQQTAAMSAARDPADSKGSSIPDIIQQIHKERGMIGFWSGYGEAVVLTSNPAITFAVDNLLTRLLPKAQRERPSAATRFLIAAISKAVATGITYPAMLAKSRAQVSDLGSDEDDGLDGSIEQIEKPDLDATPARRRVKSVLQNILSLFRAQYAIVLALRKIYHTEGLAGLYSGIEGEVLKGFVQHGLTMMVKERAQVLVLQLYYILLKSTRRWPQGLQEVQERAQGFATEAQERVEDLAGEAQERAVNIGQTVSEGVQRIAEKATGRNGDD